MKSINQKRNIQYFPKIFDRFTFCCIRCGLGMIVRWYPCPQRCNTERYGKNRMHSKHKMRSTTTKPRTNFKELTVRFLSGTQSINVTSHDRLGIWCHQTCNSLFKVYPLIAWRPSKFWFIPATAGEIWVETTNSNVYLYINICSSLFKPRQG